MVQAKVGGPIGPIILAYPCSTMLSQTSLSETEVVSHSLATEGYFQEMLDVNTDDAEGYIEISICRALQALCIVFLYEMCITCLARAMHDKRKKLWAIGKPFTATALKMVSQMHKERLDGKADSTVRAEIQADFAYRRIFMHLFQPGPPRKRRHSPPLFSPYKEARVEEKPKSAPSETGKGASAGALFSHAAGPERIPGRDSFLSRVDSMERGIHEIRAALAGVTALLDDVRSERQKQVCVIQKHVGRVQGQFGNSTAPGSRRNTDSNFEYLYGACPRLPGCASSHGQSERSTKGKHFGRICTKPSLHPWFRCPETNGQVDTMSPFGRCERSRR